MKNKSAFLTPDSLSLLLFLLFVQILFFYLLVKDDPTGPLSGLADIFWTACTAAVILFHVTFLIFSRRKLLFGIALLLSVCFWTVAWSSYKYLQRTKNVRERKKTSGEFIERQEAGKTRVEKLLREKNIFYTWLPDSLCYKIYREDGTFYYLTAGGPDGEGITASETMTNRINHKDTSMWLRGLKSIIPLLDNQQLSALDKSLKKKDFCLNRAYEGYSCAYPCWRTVVLQKYDSLTEQLNTSMHFP
jgi:hypothetical protein